MCGRAVEKNPHGLGFVPDKYKTEEMCERIVENELRRLGFVPDRFVTFKTLKDLDKDEDLDNGVLDKLIT